MSESLVKMFSQKREGPERMLTSPDKTTSINNHLWLNTVTLPTQQMPQQWESTVWLEPLQTHPTHLATNMDQLTTLMNGIPMIRSAPPVTSRICTNTFVERKLSLRSAHYTWRTKLTSMNACVQSLSTGSSKFTSSSNLSQRHFTWPPTSLTVSWKDKKFRVLSSNLSESHPFSLLPSMRRFIHQNSETWSTFVTEPTPVLR